jgi:hypothetical protein
LHRDRGLHFVFHFQVRESRGLKKAPSSLALESIGLQGDDVSNVSLMNVGVDDPRAAAAARTTYIAVPNTNGDGHSVITLRTDDPDSAAIIASLRESGAIILDSDGSVVEANGVVDVGGLVEDDAGLTQLAAQMGEHEHHGQVWARYIRNC